MRDGERQVSPTLAGIRADHKFRYQWAAKILPPGSRVLDLACGIGYGAYILAQAGHDVIAIDRDQEAIDYANKYYRHPRISFRVSDATDLSGVDRCNAVVCFETIEHIKDPLSVLQRIAHAVPLLLASVPNEEKFPWQSLNSGGLFTIAFHHRHYTKSEFADLLAASGFEPLDWFGQDNHLSEVVKNVNGRTLIVVAKRAAKTKSKSKKSKQKAAAKAPSVETKTGGRPVPKSVAILGLGPSLNTYVGIVKRLGGRHKLCDETWGINAVLDVIKCDRGFHGDDVRIQQIRADADPNGNIAAMLPWLKTHPGPIYTGRTHPDYPGLVEYPLADVLNSCGGNRYFNSTAALAMAYAVHIGVKKIFFFGADFSYASSHSAERGRACVEFWIGFAMARGITVSIAGTSTLLDACVPPAERLYGYDTVKVEITGQTGNESVSFVPREILPTAAEIEKRYDHSQPTVPEHLREPEDPAA
jgi:SAM-dependent methyltransferase